MFVLFLKFMFNYACSYCMIHAKMVNEKLFMSPNIVYFKISESAENIRV